MATYTGAKCNAISFPLGGIGTGCIGLAGNGRLIDWEIFNRPNKGSYNGFSFFSVKAETKDRIVMAKVLQGDLQPPYIGTLNRHSFRGVGFGPDRESMAGFPHFRDVAFTGEFPFATLDFRDAADDPLTVQLTAFSPFIPLNELDSSLPVAIFTYRITNTSLGELDVSVVGNLTNPFESEAVNAYVEDGGMKAIRLTSVAYTEHSPRFGDISLSTDCPDVSHQCYWYHGEWFDNLTVFWKEFTSPGRLQDRTYGDVRSGGTTYNMLDVGPLCVHKTLKPGESYDYRFVSTWSFPNFVNFVNYWNPGDSVTDGLPPM